MKSFALALMLSSIVVSAAAAAPNHASDVLRGKDIALSGNGRTPACAACHKMNGIGEGSGVFPRLTGQSPIYLYKQLYDYAHGKRKSGVMGLVAKKLSDQDMKDVAAYYASTTGPGLASAKQSGGASGRGAVLSDIGSNSERVPACTSCHGPEATGYGPVYPYLAGQFESYIKGELESFKKGQRTNDPAGVMRDVAAGLSAQDIDALAAYFASSSPPAVPAEGIATLFQIKKPSALAGSQVSSKPASSTNGEAGNNGQ